MTTDDMHEGLQVRVERSHFTLGEAVLMVAFGKGFAHADYEAKAQRDCSWQTLATLLKQHEAEVTDDSEHLACLDKLSRSPDRQLFLQLLKDCPQNRPGATETFGRLVAEAEKQARFAGLIEQAYEAICAAAHHRHIVISGELVPHANDNEPRFRRIDSFLFGPSDFRTPVLFPDTNEIRWETTHPTTEPLVYTNVEIERVGFEQWLEPQAPQSPREKKKRGPKRYYSEEAIAMIARHIAARPKVQGVTPATEKLLDAIRDMHKKKWPKSRKPSRTTVQRALDNQGWP